MLEDLRGLREIYNVYRRIRGFGNTELEGLPAKSKFPIGESLDEKDLKFFSYILGDDYEL